MPVMLKIVGFFAILAGMFLMYFDYNGAGAFSLLMGFALFVAGRLGQAS